LYKCAYCIRDFTVRCVTVRYRSTRTDQRYVTVSYITLREGGKQASNLAELINLIWPFDVVSCSVVIAVSRLYVPSMVLLCFVVPTIIPVRYWSESVSIAFFTGVLRYVAVLNVTWTVNSVAHLWGNRPYDRRINPAENCGVAFGACGEGYHNYHHVFPSDYSTSEHGWKLNPTTFFIDLMALLGLVTYRKTMSREVVRRRMERTGDGTTGFGFM